LPLALAAAFIDHKKRSNVMDQPVEREKPWRPGDHPRPGPSWGDDDRPRTAVPAEVADGED
jgi:hypothetical protein